ncbi:hypothetical protein T492DRAFT_221455 [Pavlovales sp. CCMP2436]|nr:hypothetical protein T492DRAFT_221455 [Pavlovales sp. CCMP2436]
MAAVETLGRRATQATFFAVGFCALSLAGLSTRQGWESVAFFLYSIGRVGHGAGTTAAWVACPELWRTERRATGCALAQIFSRVGVVLAIFCVAQAPPSLTSIGTSTVQLLAAAASAAGFTLAILLPETAGVQLERATDAAEEVRALSRARERLSALVRRCRW